MFKHLNFHCMMLHACIHLPVSRTIPHHLSLCQDKDDWIDTRRVGINNVRTTDGRKGKNTRARLAPAAPAKCAQGRRRG